MEESSFLLLEEGRKLSSGETNKKEKNHLYLSPSASEELETVLKQHLLFPLLLPMEENSRPLLQSPVLWTKIEIEIELTA
jgi:hypothetical protein